LSDYPEDKTYDEIIQMIFDDDFDVSVWVVYDDEPRYVIVDNIECTRAHFDAVVRQLLEEQTK